MREKRIIARGISAAIVACALAAVIFGTVLSILQAGQTISSSGSVKGVGVGIYWDSVCTNRASSINWGLLEPGSNKTVTVYVRNEGNAMATLSKTAQNWSPANSSSYMTLNWNYANQTLNANQVLQVGLTLVVSPTIAGITNFTFDITIIASG